MKRPVLLFGILLCLGSGCDRLGLGGGASGGGADAQATPSESGVPPGNGAPPATGQAAKAAPPEAPPPNGPATTGPAVNATGSDSAAGAPGEGLPGPDGAAIVEYFTKTSPYKTWVRFPRNRYPVSLATDYIREGTIRFFNGMIARVYYNEIGEKALEANAKEMPPGTMIVVERWTPRIDGSLGPEEKPDDFVVQYKIPGFDPANGDWFYLTVKGGKVTAEGKVAACQNCHAIAKKNDYRFLDSGEMSALPVNIPSVTDKGEAFVKMLTKELHYTHYDLIPDAAVGKVIPRSKELSQGIEWFNGKLEARLFANPLALATLESGGKVYPSGALLVAEQFEKKDGKVAKEPFAIVAQIKVDGADPAHGDWVWLSYNLKEEKILTFGKEAKFCYDCHTEVADFDYIWTPSNKLPAKQEK